METDLTEDSTYQLWINAYIYLYPIVIMEITRMFSTNVLTVQDSLARAPMNTFVNLQTYPDVGLHVIVRPNFDTLYSMAWLDVSEGPMILSVPNTHGRYYLMPLLDMWTNVFASIGSRTTGNKVGHYLIAMPNWKGNTPNGIVRINAPTPYVWIIGRTQTNGPMDYPNVHEIQKGYRITPLFRKQIIPAINPNFDMKTDPVNQVNSMTGNQFFSLASEIMKKQPYPKNDNKIINQLRKIGFIVGKSFNMSNPVPASVPKDALQLMVSKSSTIGPIYNKWLMLLNIGTYGDNYLKRAIVSLGGIGANINEDALYLKTIDQTLDGRLHNYTIHFDNGNNINSVPPANAFWSITLYDESGFAVPNRINRYTISSWMPLKYNKNGSLDLYIQNKNPDLIIPVNNWLPAPNSPFNLVMRLYWPKASALDRMWKPPAIIIRK